MAAIPLMLLGAALFFLSTRQGGYGTSLCSPFLSPADDCRHVGDSGGALYASARRDHDAWFDVVTGQSGYGTFEASGRLIADVTIVDAVSFAGAGPERSALIGSLIGRRGSVHLGINDQQQSIVTDQIVYLYCNNLWIDRSYDLYRAGCYGEDWSGTLTFRVNEGVERIESLKEAINGEIASRRSGSIYVGIVALFSPALMFLMASAFIWAVAKSARYVRNA